MWSGGLLPIKPGDRPRRTIHSAEVALEYGLSELGGAACSRYDCWSPWLAGQVADALREEAATPERLQYRDWVIRDYHGGELTAISLDWADEAWLGSWTNGVEEQGQVLVLRKGSVTVRVVGRWTLTDEDILENIRPGWAFETAAIFGKEDAP